jgi:ABC-2 type transport system ATP-binding protein
MIAVFSSGQLTRLNLCKALLNSPKLLLLDEPTASLDPEMVDKTLKLLKKIQEEMRITMIFTSHNMREVEEICNRCIFILNGKIADEGAPQEMIKKYGRKDLNEVFIDLVRERTEKFEEHKIHPL